MSVKLFIPLLIALCICPGLYAQHTVVTRYEHSKRIGSREVWNKSNTIAHFTYYYENGKIKAEGYMKRDRYRHYKSPYRSFSAYDSTGKQIQFVTITKDSATVLTYDDKGTLRGQIKVLQHQCSETSYDSSGKISVREECKLPDSLSYFKDYYYPDKWVKKNYTNINVYPRPLWPLGYGWAAKDGVSDPDTFKIYFEPDLQEPHPVSTGASIVYDSLGNITKTTHLPTSK